MEINRIVKLVGSFFETIIIAKEEVEKIMKKIAQKKSKKSIKNEIMHLIDYLENAFCTLDELNEILKSQKVENIKITINKAILNCYSILFDELESRDVLHKLSEIHTLIDSARETFQS